MHSPITGKRLLRAHAAGGSYWYCPDTGQRILALSEARHFLKPEGAGEIWYRSETSDRVGESCPSCLSPMRVTEEPSWMGGGTIEVCRVCRLFSVEAGTHPQIPEPKDFSNAYGDSTAAKKAADAFADTAIREHQKKVKDEALVGDGPEKLMDHVPAMLGLPVEMHQRQRTRQLWLNYTIAAILFLIHGAVVNFPNILDAFGFVPADPFRHFGATIFTSPWLHGSWWHLIVNTYFFLIFADDVEDLIGPLKFMALFLFTSCMEALGTYLFSGSPGVPHVGLSGFVSALMWFYALSFPKARLAWLLPGFTPFQPKPGAHTAAITLRWWRFPILAVAIFYYLSDLFLYSFMESAGYGTTSFASHIAGAMSGVIFLYLYRKPKSSKALLVVNS